MRFRRSDGEESLTLYMVLMLKGGAGHGGVAIKHTLKMTKGKKTSVEDKKCFEDTFNTCCQIGNAATFGIKAGLDNMEVGDLEKLRSFLGSSSSHTTTKVKADQIYTYFKEYQQMNEALKNIVTSITDFQVMVKEDLFNTFGNEDGKLDAFKLRDAISCAIGPKSSQSHSAMHM